MRTSTRLSLLFGLFVAQGCVAWPTDPSYARPVAVPDGTWSGITKGGDAITFTVKSEMVTELKLTYRIADCTTEATETLTPLKVIGPSSSGGGFFSYDHTSAATGVRVFVSGSFDAASPPRATGGLSLSKPGCQGSSNAWTAMKQ